MIDKILGYLKNHAWNDHRKMLLEGLKEALSEIARYGYIERAFLYGSYLSDKELPSDIDMVLEIGWIAPLPRCKFRDYYETLCLDIQSMRGALFDSYSKWAKGHKKVIE